MSAETKHPDRGKLPLSVLEQIDRICDEFERAWGRGERPRIEDYLGGVAGRDRPVLLHDLLAAELEARRRRGERPEPDVYQARFPGDARILVAAFAAQPPRGGERSSGATSAGSAESALLVGLLGFQTGLIGESALTEALRVWIDDKTRALPEILSGQGILDAPRRTLLEALVSEHLRLHGGDTARSLASLPAGGSTRERLARLADTDLNATLAHVGTGPTEPGVAEFDQTVAYSVGAATADGQRFRVLRPHARGGLGAVFVARDQELDREVALKQILERYADDPVSRSRFLLEAEITGGLEHPGIVPVYGLGTYGDGRPYYAMRFIKGDSLKEAIEQFHTDGALKRDPGRRSLELRKLLRRFTDVCNAIEYAHSRGVLHRDIKPGNIIVGRHGETLVVDWGLAKATGRGDPGASADERPLTPSSTGLAETMPGSALGTPAYMSPEQAAGNLDRLGPQSDVYSLGASLYCLLTGKAPFEDEDLGALLRAVQSGSFAPPRAIDSMIAPELEAICLKAMAREPGDRYTSPRSLTEEIERWMADEPVTAYREPLSARLVRWARRHKPVMAGTAALLVSAVVALVVSTLLIGREQSLTRAAYLAEAAQRKRADARSRLARVAVDDMYTQVAERWLAEQPRMEPVQREFLEKARAIYEELAAEDDSDPALRREAGAAYRRVGDIQSRLGRLDVSEQDYRRALGIADELAARFPADRNHRLDGVYALQRLAEVLIKTGRLSEAEQILGQVITSLEDPTRDDTDRPEYLRALADGHDRRGYVMRLTGRWTEAEQAYRRAVELQDILERDGRSTPETLRARAGTLHNFGDALHRGGRLDESIRNIRQAIILYEKLLADAPGSPIVRGELAMTLVGLGFTRSDKGEVAEAERDIRGAIAIFRRLVDDFPRVPDYRKRLESAYNNLAIILVRMGRRPEAEEAYRKSIELAEALAAESPGVPDLRADLVRNVGNFGNFLQDSGNPREAEASLRRAVGLSESLTADFPKVPEYRTHFLALNLYNLADALLANGRGVEAERTYGRAWAIMESTSTEANDTALVRLIRGGALGHLGTFRLERREFADAVRLLDRALVEGRKALERAPGSPDPLQLIAEHASFLSRARLALGDKVGAAGASAEAARAATELARGAADQPPALVEIARILIRCATAADDPATRRDYTDRAVEAIRLAIVKGFRNAESLSHDPDLGPLKSRPELQPLFMDLAFPADPFAR